nr:acylphosphatase [Ruania rhizosphaerae]
MQAWRIRVEGRVQGVGYRRWLARQASKRSVSGWVRNCDDGAVEALLCGEPGDVGYVLARSRQGPATGHVSVVTASRSAVEPRDGFDVVDGITG